MKRLILSVFALLLTSHPAWAAAAKPGIAKHAAGPDVAKAAKRVEVAVGNSPTRGPADARVTLIVFSDFQCPYCARGATLARDVEKKYGKDVRVAFKQLPLDFHQHAALAAEASLAAHAQGRFWEYHDVLFSSQDALDRASLERHAKTVGLDLVKFKKALDTHAYAAAVEKDRTDAFGAGITGTPTFLVNGRLCVGAGAPEALHRLIDEELLRR